MNIMPWPSKGTALKNKEKADLDKLIDKLYGCKFLHIKNVEAICLKAKEVLREEPNIVNVASPVTVCGDIHGQHHDLMKLFDIAGRCPRTNFLFLGDYVDRGMYSVECFTLLIALKVRHPKRIFLLRGNHECQAITAVYGLYEEVMQKYKTSKVWEYFCQVFELLPLAALIEGKIFCVHGGLSPSLDRLDNIRAIKRFKKPGPCLSDMTNFIVNKLFHGNEGKSKSFKHKHGVPAGMLCDLLWSDPNDDPKFEGYGISPRGAGFTWGKDVTEKWIHDNDLTFITRGHQLVMDGYEEKHNGLVWTIFSCPNYISRMNNLGAFMQVAEDLSHRVITFETAGPKGLMDLPKMPKAYFD